ncbi:MAG: sulfatase [Planctomycetes bacterium]|nr:sulfatase [Planctomycetota bacterium]
MAPRVVRSLFSRSFVALRCERLAWFSLCAFVVVALERFAAAQAPRKTNIVLIVADDLGYADLGVQGSKDVRTPNLDRLAEEGVRFTDAYVTAPLCAPSRAALLTGRYAQRFGLESNPGPERGAAPDYGIPRDEPVLSERLKAAGFATGMFGKWHVGYPRELRPTKRGFDEFLGFLSGSSRYFTAKARNPILRGDEPAKVDAYLTDAFASEAVAFIDKRAEHPFFLYVPFNAVHNPLEVPDADLERFAKIADPRRRQFAAMLAKLDDGVGAILKALEAHGLDENTLVIFLSDNGGATVETTSRNDPLRGTKAQMYEGGIRVPFLMRWKGKLTAGAVESRTISSLDVVPTALAAAGVAADTTKPLDGVNLLPYLAGEREGKPHESLFWRMGHEGAARVGDWKLVLRGDEAELYDLSEDVAEKTDLAKRRPEILAKLRAAWTAWAKPMVAPRWEHEGERGEE